MNRLLCTLMALFCFVGCSQSEMTLFEAVSSDPNPTDKCIAELMPYCRAVIGGELSVNERMSRESVCTELVAVAHMVDGLDYNRTDYSLAYVEDQVDKRIWTTVTNKDVFVPVHQAFDSIVEETFKHASIKHADMFEKNPQRATYIVMQVVIGCLENRCK